jgi:hypothetical protein
MAIFLFSPNLSSAILFFFLARMILGHPISPKQIGKFVSEVLTLGLPDDRADVVLLEPTVKVPNNGKLF